MLGCRRDGYVSTSKCGSIRGYSEIRHGELRLNATAGGRVLLKSKRPRRQETPLPEYKIVWFPEFVMNGSGPVELTKTSEQVNEWAAAGWRVHQVTPGTNAQTYSGLFVTFVSGN